MRNLSGIIIPTVTPFDENGEIRFDMLQYNYEQWNKTAVNGFMCLGSNGEFRMLSDDEALEVIRAASSYADPDKCFIAGVGRESLYQTLRFIDRVQAENLPIDYLSVLTPHYFKGLMTDAALVEYYTKIADYSKIPILLYCAPAFSNEVTISAEVVRILADHPNIHGIKDTSKNMMNAYMDAAGGRDDFEIVSGSMSSVFTCMDRGGKGGVVSASNYFPAQCAEVVRLYQEEGREKAWEYYTVLNEVIKKTGARGSVAGVKCTMNLMGLKGGVPRKPVQPISQELEAEMKQALLDAGFIS
ncbi:MAG: dihydrodipicolinate synthase family protein [Ruminococcaceae bacterium]|nr:dihydrodipicolinate synthase family protein [Oscillospiraceae bacterium]